MQRELTPTERNVRANVRNFLLTASLEELRRELALSFERNDSMRARFVQELITEETDATN